MKPDTRITVCRWSYACALALIIVLASGRGQVATLHVVDFDKIAHFFVYGLLATLVARAGFPGRKAWLAVLIVSLFGLTDEWHQSFTPGRSVEMFDWVADTLGALTAIVAYTYWRGYRRMLEWSFTHPQSRVEKHPQVVPNQPS